jgi:hypothetical protein
MSGNGLGGLHNEGHVWLAVSRQRRWNTDEDSFHIGKPGKIGRCFQLPGCDCFSNHCGGDASDITPSSVERGDFVLVNIKTDNLATAAEKLCSQRQPNVAQTNDANG